MSTNRREFLKRSGGLAVAGWVGASGLAVAAEATSTAKTAAIPGPGMGSIERWLLETGRPELGDDVYHACADGKC